MKKPKLENITADMDKDDYELLLEKKPTYLDDIRKELKRGLTPLEIGAYIRRKRPDRWPQSKAIEGAARYILNELKKTL